jgi:outer membrane protein assembly factor BamB
VISSDGAYCFSENGKQKWKTPLEGAGVAAHSASGILLSSRTQLMYIDKNSGKELWKKGLASPPESVALGENMAFISGQLQKESEQAPVQDERMGEAGGAPAAEALGVYGMPAPVITGIDLKEGKEVWRKQNMGGSIDIRGTLLLSVGQIPVADVLDAHGGMLKMITAVNALLPRNGKLALSFHAKTNLRQSVISAGKIFLVTERNETRLGANGPETVVFESRFRAIRRRDFSNRMLVF